MLLQIIPSLFRGKHREGSGEIGAAFHPALPELRQRAAGRPFDELEDFDRSR